MSFACMFLFRHKPWHLPTKLHVICATDQMGLRFPTSTRSLHCRCLGPAELTPALLSLLQPVLGSLATAATSFAPRLTGGPAGSFREQVYLVDRLAMLLRNVNAPPAAAELLKQ